MRKNKQHERGRNEMACYELLFLLFLGGASVSGRPPNFVLFFADDMGYGDAGCYGHPTILTPNIDSLARSGMKFTQFYSAYPICTPSRSGLLTGRLPIRSGIYTAYDWPVDMAFRVFLPISEGGLPATEITIPQVLKNANYTSALIGKWHLGHVNSMPTQRGFDEFYGLPYAQDEGCPPRCGTYVKEWHGVPLYDNLTIIEQPVNLSTLTPRYNVRAMDFIDRNKDNPFFLMMAYDEVHVPLFASKSFLNTSLRGLYGDAAQEMDASIGVVMQKLRELGLENNTLVIFTSDNGAWTDKGLAGGSNGLLRGQKGETWEGGMRIPAIAYWPGKISPAKVSVAVGSQLDFLATYAELAGVPVPNRTLDSHSLVPILFGGGYETGEEVRDKVFYYRGHTLMAVRYGNYKAHYVTRPGWNLDPPETHNPPILYNLAQDPSEAIPLEASDYAGLLDELDAIIKEHTQSIGTPPKAQLDDMDWTEKVAPCCNHDDDCVCSTGGGPVGVPFVDGADRNEYGPSLYYQRSWL
jgi:arylsulfatase A